MRELNAAKAYRLESPVVAEGYKEHKLRLSERKLETLRRFMPGGQWLVVSSQPLDRAGFIQTRERIRKLWNKEWDDKTSMQIPRTS